MGELHFIFYFLSFDNLIALFLLVSAFGLGCQQVSLISNIVQ